MARTKQCAGAGPRSDHLIDKQERRTLGHGQALFSLPDNLMDRCKRLLLDETPQIDHVAISHIPIDGFGHGYEFFIH